jgi:acetolactate synthase-1/2/3 large subunit
MYEGRTDGVQRVGEAVGDAIVAQGVTTVFGLVGEGNVAVAQRLGERPDVRWFAARREDAVVSMADGYVRRAGVDAGFATVTCGPGLTNALTAITEARKAGTPMVILTGDTPVSEHLHPQAIDEQAFSLATGAGVHTVRTSLTAVEDVEIAFQRARDERRPIVLVLPVDLVDVRYRGAPPRPTDGLRVRRPMPAAPPDGTVREVLGALAGSTRPAILAGRGAVDAGARDTLVALAEQLGAPLATTLRARGLFAGHRLAVGMAGGFPDGSANECLAAADLVLAFGTSLSDQTTKGGSLLRAEDVVVFTDDPASCVSSVRPTRVVATDVGLAAVALTAALERHDATYLERRGPASRWDQPRPGADVTAEDEDRPFDARALAASLDELAPPNRNVVVDLGYFTAEACRYVAVDGPRRFLYAVNFGSIGLSVATAAGASVADPDVPTLALVGDGGLMMSVGELETIARYKLPVTVVVFDDSALGIEYHALRLRRSDPSLVEFPDVDFAAVARAVGMDAVTVRSPDELRRACSESIGWVRPTLIDGRIDGTVETEWLQELVAAGWHGHAS